MTAPDVYPSMSRRGRSGSAASVAAQCQSLLDTLDATVPDKAALRA
ncbi:hypothetical protein [Burkholderia pyrrocinia]|nr:hypothetical protein [Burkholderia pyrrocinia]